MTDSLRDRLTDHIAGASIQFPHLSLPEEGGKLDLGIPAESMADALLPFVQEEIDLAVLIERGRWRDRALPDRWVSLRRVDLIGLFEEYRDRRGQHGEDHEAALEHVLAEVDFEPNQGDVDEESYRRNTS